MSKLQSSEVKYGLPSAEYADLAEALNAVAPFVSPPTARDLSSTTFDQSREHVKSFGHAASMVVQDIALTGTVSSLNGSPLHELDNTSRKNAVDVLVKLVYEQDTKPIAHRVTEYGVTFLWKPTDHCLRALVSSFLTAHQTKE